MFRINKKVWLISSRKTDGRYNQGKIVGVKQCYNCLGFVSKSQFLKDITIQEYQVAYIDVVTNKACIDWVHHSYVTDVEPDE